MLLFLKKKIYIKWNNNVKGSLSLLRNTNLLFTVCGFPRANQIVDNQMQSLTCTAVAPDVTMSQEGKYTIA